MVRFPSVFHPSSWPAGRSWPQQSRRSTRSRKSSGGRGPEGWFPFGRRNQRLPNFQTHQMGPLELGRLLGAVSRERKDMLELPCLETNSIRRVPKLRPWNRGAALVPRFGQMLQTTLEARRVSGRRPGCLFVAWHSYQEKTSTGINVAPQQPSPCCCPHLYGFWDHFVFAAWLGEHMHQAWTSSLKD